MQLVHSIRQDLTRLAQVDLSGLLFKTGKAKSFCNLIGTLLNGVFTYNRSIIFVSLC